MATALKFLSFNARGLRQSKKRRQLFAFIHRRKPDISIIQESHSCINDESYWQNEWGGKAIFSHGSNTSRGVCILIKPSLDVEVIKSDVSPFGRFIIVDIKINDCIFTVVGIYAPNIDNPDFFCDISSRLNNFMGDTIIVAGD